MESSPLGAKEDLASQREVVAALMKELKRVRKKAHKLKAKSGKHTALPEAEPVEAG
eukprot:CAMPEP_0197927106 /NCGR_PEP_ID=MMETSP1439-20131203/100223_1 /TAXON_ID=66791 /ORGANISM="Gonyaulax spinifera, Strain CCMP409" /LENGTH=55 /DNA_ID=CAMNT_0043549657 /DNA_START=57 /DNA_END=224 /DNA_ORIENTATION=+